MTDEREMDRHEKPKRGEPVTLAPLSELDAIKGLLETPPPPEGWTKKTRKKRVKKEQGK
jgi:hypothetical protein